MGLRTKFNLMLLAVALVGVALFALASMPVLQGQARDTVLQDSRIMMESAAGVRKYTSEQVAPLLEPTMSQTFHPQAVSAYAATKTFDVLHAKFTDYTYREPALNPTNPSDQATDWESDIINGFRNDATLQETSLVRQTATGDVLVLARPLVNKQACLTCHSTPAAAPKSMIAIYGPDHGFGWKLNEVVAAQIVSVPMALPQAMANQAELVFLGLYTAVFLLLFVMLNVMLNIMVLGPMDRMAKTADAVSLGQLETPEYVREGKDQIAKLSVAINRLRRSLQEALRMLSGE
jgi:HAMP domain-containing protein